MKLTIMASFLLIIVAVAQAQQKVISLYDGSAQGSENWSWAEKETDSNMAHIKIVYNVVKPTLTVFPAEGAPNGTAAIICPGGGFHILSINSEGNDVANWLAKRGVTCFVLRYRLAHSVTNDPFREMMQGLAGGIEKFDESIANIVPLATADARQAITYVRKHAADFGISPDRVGIIGFSAGGTLAQAVAFNYIPDNRPDFVASIYGNVPAGQNTDVMKDAPPMFIAAATNDQLHLVPKSIQLYNLWLAAGKSVEMHIYENGGHGFGLNKQKINTDTWIDRFGDWLQQRGFITAPKPAPQDWPNLNRFATENEKVKAMAATKEKRVVFLGNSITEAWLRLDSAFFAGNTYINRGISGQTTPQMLLRFRQDVIELKPAAVVILAGTNDIAGNTGPVTLATIMGNITSMAELAKANKIRVVLSSVLPAFEYPWRPGQTPAEKIVALNSMIKEYATKNGCVYLDYFSAMADERKGLPASLSTDGVHPNLAGYKVMEPLAEKAIKEALR